MAWIVIGTVIDKSCNEYKCVNDDLVYSGKYVFVHNGNQNTYSVSMRFGGRAMRHYASMRKAIALAKTLDAHTKIDWIALREMEREFKRTGAVVNRADVSMLGKVVKAFESAWQEGIDLGHLFDWIDELESKRDLFSIASESGLYEIDHTIEFLRNKISGLVE